MSLPKYSDLVLQYIEAIQREKLVAIYGPSFEDNLAEIFPDNNFFMRFIELKLEEEFQDDLDKRFELEAKFKNNSLEAIVNVTRFEFSQYKALLNKTALIYNESVSQNISEHVPYSATLYSDEPDAEILIFSDLDKPIIFFHGGLFSANLMYCKLAIQLISGDKNDNLDYYASFLVKEDEETIKSFSLNAAYFYNYYLSDISKEVPSYDLYTPFENNILAIFLESISLFIYSHEAGHAYYNHNQTQEEKTTEELWVEEFDADLFAMERMLDYCNFSKANILTLIGPILFFRYRILLEKHKPAIGAKSTHPPTDQRLQHYLLWLIKRIHPRDHQSLHTFLAFEHKLYLVINKTFEQISSIVSSRASDSSK